MEYYFAIPMFSGPANNKRSPVAGITSVGGETQLPGAGIALTDATLSNGPYYAFQPYTAMTITAIVDADGFSGGSNLLNITLDPGAIYNWRFKSITFTGTAAFFKGV